ncbi:hypothetical protein [Amycolatopsis sp. H20-H5]|uniref:hypothetical protein n=1 Tax=Amycolatopsis sp. H20-H5 TaxID=3046309 RepID=UPI002DBB6B54|nr:hypothetical protein [Amycolatopsis sp. H20-H5]MEC3975231.1 hypothetical protein [Amycolatopsis sp. H20-H5]
MSKQLPTGADQATTGPPSSVRNDPVAYVAVHDIALNEVCLAWDSSHRSPLIQAFATLAAARTA